MPSNQPANLRTPQPTLPTDTVLQVKDIEFHYPHSDYRMRLGRIACASGKAIAIVGPSGCGKTTFLNLAAGILTPSSGTIAVNGIILSSLSPAAAAAFRLSRIGLIFQEFELVEHLTVGDNILLPIHLGLTSRRVAIETEARKLADRSGISRYWKKRPRHLSHGERQRVAICRALSTDPDLILADEPTGNLDPANKRKALDLMIASAREHGRALVVATHDLELLDAFDEVFRFDELNENQEGRP